MLALTPATAFAVSVQEIVALSKAGVSEQVILALIERDKTIFSLDADQLVALKNIGVSEPIVLAMLRSGRQEAAPPAPVAAPPFPIEPITSEPDIVVVGRGPQRPNAPDPYEVPPAPYAVPYIVPYYVPVGVPQASCGVRRSVPPAPSTTGQFFTNTIPGQFFTNTVPGQFFVDNNVNRPSVGAGVHQPTQTFGDCFTGQAPPRGRHFRRR